MEVTIEQALQQGVAAYKEGKLQDAERLYRAILRTQPAHPDANYNLGILAVSVNKADVALPLLKIALEAKPNIEKYWLTYIDALIIDKQFDNARQTLKQAREQEFSADRLDSLEGRLLRNAQKSDASQVQPSKKLLDSLLSHYESERLSDAEDLALRITREFPDHHFAWKVLGAVLKQTGRAIESVTAMQKSAKLAPKDPEVHNYLGSTLRELGRLDEAQASYNRAIALKPDFASAHYNLGNALSELGRLEESLASYRQSIALKPDFHKAHKNYGDLLLRMGQHREGLNQKKVGGGFISFSLKNGYSML